MRKFIVGAIQFVGVFMLVVGTISFFVCMVKAQDASRYLFRRDALSEFMWNIGAIQSLCAALSSFFVFGFSYIVKAACLYIEKREEEQYENVEETE